MRVNAQKRESLLERNEPVQRQSTERVFDLFKGRSGAVGWVFDDWLAAERETLWTPPVALVETEDEFLVEAAIRGVSARDLEVLVSSTGVLIQGRSAHQHRPGELVYPCEVRPGRLVRTIEFPRPVDPDKVNAEYRNGLLRIWAPVADDLVRKVAL
jgi:HSP20 family protein